MPWLGACCSFVFCDRISDTLVCGWLPVFALEMHTLACRANHSHASCNKDKAALKSKFRMVSGDSTAREGENNPGLRAFCPGSPHGTSVAAAAQEQDLRAGCGAASASCRKANSRSRTTESNFVCYRAACQLSAHGSSAPRGRREKERKKHLSFSLRPQSTEGGRGGLG